MRFLELKIPPPLVLLAVAGFMWSVAAFGPSLHLPVFLRQVVAAIVAAAGFAVNIGGIVSFRRAKTTVHPMKPETASSLVSTGLFAVTRNPMYLGMLIVLLGWAIYLSSAWALLGPLMFVFYITRFQILPEERALATLFGGRFAEYKQSVRRWL